MLAQFVLYVGAALLVGGLAMRHLLTSGPVPLAPGAGVPRLRWPVLGLGLLGLGAAWKTYAVLAQLEMLNVTDTVDFLTRVPAGRSALYLLLGACLLLAAHLSRFSRLTEVGAAALTLWGLTGLGHGATHGDAVRLAHVLHAGSMVVWVAGVGTLLVARPLPPRAAPTFSKLATACVVLLFASGLLMTTSHAGSLLDLPASPYGRWLLLKVSVFAAVLLVAFFVRRQVSRLETVAPLLALEAALLTVVLTLTAALSTLPPPAHSF